MRADCARAAHPCAWLGNPSHGQLWRPAAARPLGQALLRGHAAAGCCSHNVGYRPVPATPTSCVCLGPACFGLGLPLPTSCPTPTRFVPRSRDYILSCCDEAARRREALRGKEPRTWVKGKPRDTGEPSLRVVIFMRPTRFLGLLRSNCPLPERRGCRRLTHAPCSPRPALQMSLGRRCSAATCTGSGGRRSAW